MVNRLLELLQQDITSKVSSDASVNVSATNSNSKRHSWITYRLGEFYLDYAEAVFKYLGNADAKNVELTMSASEAVNVIRNRSDVKMPAFCRTFK